MRYDILKMVNLKLKNFIAKWMERFFGEITIKASPPIYQMKLVTKSLNTLKKYIYRKKNIFTLLVIWV